MNSRARRIITVAAVLLVVIAASRTVVSAQTAGYVSLAGFGDIRQFGSTTPVSYPTRGGGDTSMDVTGAGGSLRIGTFLHPRWSLELGLDVATTETATVDFPVYILMIYPPLPFPDVKASSSFVDVSTMVGFHTPKMGRVQLAYRGGFSFLRGKLKTDYSGFGGPRLAGTEFIWMDAITSGLTRLPSPTTIVAPGTFTQTFNTGALTLGFDAAIDAARHLAIVPEIRALVFSMPVDGPAVFLIRPGIGLRWNF